MVLEKGKENMELEEESEEIMVKKRLWCWAE